MICYIRNDETSHKFNRFMFENSSGLTQAGMSRLNKSIEVLVYCILGSQVNVRSPIIGSSGSAKGVQR